MKHNNMKHLKMFENFEEESVDDAQRSIEPEILSIEEIKQKLHVSELYDIEAKTETPLTLSELVSAIFKAEISPIETDLQIESAAYVLMTLSESIYSWRDRTWSYKSDRFRINKRHDNKLSKIVDFMKDHQDRIGDIAMITSIVSRNDIGELEAFGDVSVTIGTAASSGARELTKVGFLK